MPARSALAVFRPSGVTTSVEFEWTSFLWRQPDGIKSLMIHLSQCYQLRICIGRLDLPELRHVAGHFGQADINTKTGHKAGRKWQIALNTTLHSSQSEERPNIWDLLVRQVRVNKKKEQCLFCRSSDGKRPFSYTDVYCVVPFHKDLFGCNNIPWTKGFDSAGFWNDRRREPGSDTKRRGS